MRTENFQNNCVKFITIGGYARKIMGMKGYTIKAILAYKFATY